MLVFNLSTGDEYHYSDQEPKEALITTVALETKGATQIHDKQLRTQLASSIVEGSQSIAIGDWATLK